MVDDEIIDGAENGKINDPGFYNEVATRCGTDSNYVKERTRKLRNKNFVSKRISQPLQTSESLDGEFSKYNFEKGTLEQGKLSSSEPQSPEEVIRLHKIDETKWKLSSYWSKSKGKPGGKRYYLVSALFTAKAADEIDLGEAASLISEIFVDKEFEPFIGQNLPSNEKALFVYTADKHIGAYVSGRALYQNDYNAQTYESRMKEVLYEIQYLHSVYGRFEDIFIIDMGDKPDGQNGKTTRGGHSLPQNMTNREVFDTIVKVEKEFCDVLFQSDLSNNHHYHQVTTSNHGGDMEYMASKAVELYINQKYPEVSTRVFEKFIEHLEYGNHVMLICHGKDEEDMKHGLPLHLNEKAENYINKYILEYNLRHKEKTISFIKADLHQESSQRSYSFRYRNVLSLFGASKWIGHNFGPNKAGCSIDIIEKGTNRIFEYPIIFQ
jgi:hypothetical protein